MTNLNTNIDEWDISETGYITQDEMDEVISSIEKQETINYELTSKMDVAQIELALMIAGFTRVISDTVENGTLFYPIEKEELISWFIDELSSEMEGYGLPESFWTVLYKDGSKKYLNDTQNDFTVGRYTKTASKQNYVRAKSALHLREVAAIIREDGYDQPRYFVNKGCEQQMRDYGFEFWNEGRGENNVRNYIQDDWV